MKKGVDSESPARKPPNAGPMMVPIPPAAPSKPIPPPRSFSGVLSPMKAMLVGAVAEDRIPDRMRAANSIHNQQVAVFCIVPFFDDF